VKKGKWGKIREHERRQRESSGARGRRAEERMGLRVKGGKFGRAGKGRKDRMGEEGRRANGKKRGV